MPDAPSHTAQPPNLRRRYITITAYVLIALTVVVLVWIDHGLKSSPILGYRPANAEWTIATGDFGKSWTGFEETRVVQTLRAETPFPIDDLILSVRRATGVRLTPARWRTYLGRRFVASTSPDGSGWSARPGLLLRGLSLVHSTFFATSLGDDMHSFGALAYTLHDGFLLVSSSTDYLRAARDADPLPMDEDVPDAGFSLHKAGPSEWTMTISAEEGLPINGQANIEIAGRTKPLTLAGAWPEKPLLAITGSNPRQLIATLTDLLDTIPGSDRFTQSMAEMGFMLPQYTGKGGAEFAFAVLDVDTSRTLAVPEMALVLRGVRPQMSVMPPAQSIPFEWNGHPGWIRPWLGEKFAVCWTADENHLYYANQQSIMARTVGRMETSSPSTAHIDLALDWAKFSRVAADLVREAADHELLPRMNRSDAESLVLPYFFSLAQFGSLHVQGKSDGSTVEFTGRLADTDEEPAATESDGAS